MRAAASVPQSRNQALPGINLPGLDVKVSGVQLPDVVKTETVVKSARKGAKALEKVEEIPFSAELRVLTSSSKEALADLGVAREPDRAFALHLSLEKKGNATFAIMSFTSAYTTTEDQQRSRERNVRYIPTGQHTPYGPKDSPGYWETETEYYTEKVTVERTESASGVKIEGKAFNQLYLAILNAADDQKKTELLQFLHDNFPELSKKAQAWISKCLKDRVEEAQAKLAQEANVFQNLQLPAIGR